MKWIIAPRKAQSKVILVKSLIDLLNGALNFFKINEFVLYFHEKKIGFNQMKKINHALYKILAPENS